MNEADAARGLEEQCCRMDEQLLRVLHDADAELRSAAHWWLQLRERGSDSRMLRDFASWLARSAEHRRAFARIEVLGQTIQNALSARPVTTAASELRASRAGSGGGK